MKNIIRFLGVLVTALAMQSGMVCAQNLAVNPGFENGNTSGWSPFGSPGLSVVTSPVHTGSFAGLAQNRTQTYYGFSQSFFGTMQAGQTYNISVWVQLVSGGSQTVQVTAQKIDGSGTTFAAVGGAVVSAGAWTQITGQYTLSVSGTLTNITLYVEVPGSATVSYYLDDFSVTPPSTSGTSLVDAANVHQRIDGFGASSAWRGTWTLAQENMFFATNMTGTGTTADGRTNFSYVSVGLSLLRSRVAPGGVTQENTVMQAAQRNGARVWSTPWSPQTNFKNNNNVNGGSFVGTTANYQAYAAQLAGYVSAMKSVYGINLYALSIQNEPDAQVTTYESCNWSAQQFHDFVPYLYSALIASNAASTKIILPESQNWQDYSNLAVTAMSDSTSNMVSIIADHNYDGTTGPVPLTKNSYGKALWETEVSLLSGNDSSITNGVYYAGRIHQFMTVAQANAWHYWWLISGNSVGNQGLADTNGLPAKRMYALGQFSRFVRPGFNRIGVSGAGDAEVSAYQDSTSEHFAIVAINPDGNALSQTITLTNFNAGTVTPWITSGTQSLAVQTAIAVTNQTFTYTLPAMSIVTFVGVASNTPPVLAAVASQTIGAGMTLLLTNMATDASLLLPPLTYSLASGPANATVGASSGILSWRAPVSLANTTNWFSVSVADNSQPPLTSTNLFSVTVNPLATPTLGSLSLNNGQVNLTVSGPTGPDYALLTSTNMMSWQVLMITNSPTLPITLMDTNAIGGAAKFYRIQLGP